MYPIPHAGCCCKTNSLIHGEPGQLLSEQLLLLHRVLQEHTARPHTTTNLNSIPRTSFFTHLPPPPRPRPLHTFKPVKDITCWTRKQRTHTHTHTHTHNYGVLLTQFLFPLVKYHQWSKPQPAALRRRTTACGIEAAWLGGSRESLRSADTGLHEPSCVSHV